MGKSNLGIFSKVSGNLKLSLGFTLVELLVVIAMISIMASLLILLIDPLKQLEKANDAKRIQDLRQISVALDTYTNDKNSYPQTVNFGGSFLSGSTVYMQKVPQDPECNHGLCYGFLAAASGSQWGVLFSKIFNVTNDTEFCPLEKLANCLPVNYVSKGYNYCVVLGQPDCSFISTHNIP